MTDDGGRVDTWDEHELQQQRIIEDLKAEIEGLRAVRDERDKLLLKEPPLLLCVDCKNTESCAGAMARQFNHGRCVHCGGYFKVVRA